MFLSAFHSVHAPLPPADGLPLDLGEPGDPAGAVFPLVLLHGPVDDEKDDLGGKAGEVVDGVKVLKVVGGQHLAQPPLDLLDQQGKGGGGILQLPVDVGGGVLRRLSRRRRGRRLGPVGKLQLYKKGEGVKAVPRLLLLEKDFVYGWEETG